MHINCVPDFLKESIVLKYLVLILSAFSLNEQGKAARTLQEAIRFEIAAIIYKILLGIVLTSIIIFSLFQFGLKAKIFLDSFENGLTLQLISFGSISLTGILLLYFLFKRNQAGPDSKNDSDSDKPDLQELGINFVEGIIEGYQQNQINNDSTNRQEAEFSK